MDTMGLGSSSSRLSSNCEPRLTIASKAAAPPNNHLEREAPPVVVEVEFSGIIDKMKRFRPSFSVDWNTRGVTQVDKGDRL
jgi:hypothetical protein